MFNTEQRSLFKDVLDSQMLESWKSQLKLNAGVIALTNEVDHCVLESIRGHVLFIFEVILLWVLPHINIP